MDLSVTHVGYVLAGVVVGVLIGAVGVDGGKLMTPILIRDIRLSPIAEAVNDLFCAPYTTGLSFLSPAAEYITAGIGECIIRFISVVLVVSRGGYRFSDCIKVGVPLASVGVMLLLPPGVWGLFPQRSWRRWET